MMRLSDFEKNEVFFEKALREGLDNESIQVLEVTTASALPKGHNFLSNLLKVFVKYTKISETGSNIEESTTLIIKAQPTQGGEGLRLIKEQELFKNEIQILKNALPKIEKSVGEQLGPRFIYHRNEPPIIVMEDLTPRGFIVKDRQKGLSKAHVLLAMECIAKFHAGSVKLCEEEPDTVKSFTRGILTESTPRNMYRLTERSFVALSEAVKTWPDVRCVRASDKIRNMKNDFTKRILDTYKYDSDEFCVLNHGDCWINNMLFRENDRGEPCAMLMVDYQMSVYTSPAIDLHYMLNTCPSVELKCDMENVFLEHYLKTLSSYMEMLSCVTRVPTMEQLKSAMFKRRLYGVTFGLIFFPRMNANSDQVEDFDEILLAGETKMDVLKNPCTVQHLRKMIAAMDDKGYFD